MIDVKGSVLGIETNLFVWFIPMRTAVVPLSAFIAGAEEKLKIEIKMSEGGRLSAKWMCGRLQSVRVFGGLWSAGFKSSGIF